jgi:predicted phage terminase large subunit-like protein
MNYVPQQPWNEQDFELLEEYYAAESRESLWAFRQYMDPTFQRGWWVHEVSEQLQKFFVRLENNERPTLLLEAPPQHGKSRGLIDFVAWASGKRPSLRTIYASYSDDLGVAANMFLQRMFDDRTKYGRVFPATAINETNVVTMTGRYLRNSSFLEFVGQKGSFRNVTVRGQVTGKGLDLGIVDDPIKGRAEAQSPTIRNSTWAWLMDDFFNRFSEFAGLIITMTRWHVDDPAGRFLERFPDAVVLKYPALALGKPIKGNSANDPRVKGEPLFPEFKSKTFLMERKRAYTEASWQSLYQQSPIVSGGGLFPIVKLHYMPHPPAADDIKKTVRYWDKAGTQDGGAYTAGVLMHELNDGRWVIEDVRRGQLNAWDREKLIKATAEADDAKFARVEIWVEREPGSGGKESAERTIAMLKGHIVKEDRVTGDKETRAEPYAAQWQGGNILLVAASWNANFVDEHESFPSGTYKDQVDAAAGAFAKLVSKTYKYDATMSWVK